MYTFTLHGVSIVHLRRGGHRNLPTVYTHYSTTRVSYIPMTTSHAGVQHDRMIFTNNKSKFKHRTRISHVATHVQGKKKTNKQTSNKNHWRPIRDIPHTRTHAGTCTCICTWVYTFSRSYSNMVLRYPEGCQGGD